MIPTTYGEPVGCGLLPSSLMAASTGQVRPQEPICRHLVIEETKHLCFFLLLSLCLGLVQNSSRSRYTAHDLKNIRGDQTEANRTAAVVLVSTELRRAY